MQIRQISSSAALLDGNDLEAGEDRTDVLRSVGR
jgi:hypothetical protein